MRIDHGCFERPADQLFDRAQARVIAEPPDFERLELRDFESGDQLSPCLAWCHRDIGRGYCKWEMVSGPEGDIFYFTQPDDAEKFFAVFNKDGVTGPKDLLLAA
jgi:hypothetical protein